MNELENFIVLEGIDGSGTTTQGHLLSERIHNAIFTCEPTSGEIGKLIRNYLSGEKKIDRKTLTCLFASDRSDHLFGTGGVIDRVKSKLVFCDRYILSTYAYQILDVSEEVIDSLNSIFPIPELTIFLDTKLETAMSRVNLRSNKEIYEVEELQRKIQNNYTIAIDRYRAKGWNIEIIDGNGSIEDNYFKIINILKKYEIPVDKRGEII